MNKTGYRKGNIRLNDNANNNNVISLSQTISLRSEKSKILWHICSKQESVGQRNSHW
jgi:hypothetical protein